jgi:hypothetical protein
MQVGPAGSKMAACAVQLIIIGAFLLTCYCNCYMRTSSQFLTVWSETGMKPPPYTFGDNQRENRRTAGKAPRAFTLTAIKIFCQSGFYKITLRDPENNITVRFQKGLIILSCWQRIMTKLPFQYHDSERKNSNLTLAKIPWC